MSVIKSLIKIDLSDQQDIFLFCSFEPTKKLHVALLNINKCTAYSGYATELDLRSQAATIHMVFNDFLTLTTNALTKNESEGDNFLYCLEKNCESFIFKWKSIDSDETVINIGSLKVSQTDYECLIKDVFLMLSKELFSLNSKVLNMEKDMSVAKKEKEDAVKLVTDITDMKEQVERELYSKFIIVLNEKKEKIRNLKRSSSGASTNNAVNKKSKTSKSIKAHQISDSSDEATSDLEKMDVAGPSTSKRNNSFQFFDDEERVLPSPTKRRDRQRNAAVKKIEFKVQAPKKISSYVSESESEDDLLLNL